MDTDELIAGLLIAGSVVAIIIMMAGIIAAVGLAAFQSLLVVL